MAFCCVECKPCNGAGALFKCRRPTLQLRRAFGKMKVRGRRRAGSFSSVRAVFWPLMSMRSDADDRPRNASIDDTPRRAASMTTTAMVLALQARLDDAVEAPATTTGTTGTSRAPLPTTAATVLALQAQLGVPASPPEATATTGAASPARDVTPTAAATRVVVAWLGDAATPTNKAGTFRVQALREHATVVDVEEACRSFEKHLKEMLVEERNKVMDPTDVEDLLCCWDKLRSPVFAQLVGRFYGELCIWTSSPAAAATPTSLSSDYLSDRQIV
jgi:hypothetical protein